MRCPFLREAQVKSCRASSCRKMIAQVEGQPATERCSSPAYVECAAAKPHLDGNGVLAQCPFLHESLVQFCGAASLTKYIPYSEAVLSHCGTESHRYCELYLAFAQPDRCGVQRSTEGHPVAGPPLEKEVMVEGIRVRTDLFYSPNHMWADLGEDGTVHIGIDSFLAGLLGRLDQISYVTPRGFHSPTVVFTVNGTDLPMTFPHSMSITSVNTALRTHPSRLFTDPYTMGWLFEGTGLDTLATKHTTPSPSTLLAGSDAVEWMREEVRHAAAVVHELSHVNDSQGGVLMADGGVPQPGVVHLLTRDELLHVFNELFSPLAGWRKSQ